MDKFDPYHKWLGIPPEDQPPHHYRLLAINLFESDLEVIDMAADRQMSFLKQCTGGPHVAHSQELLNAVAAARLCLLRPASKAAYDAELKSKLRVGTRFEPSEESDRLEVAARAQAQRPFAREERQAGVLQMEPPDVVMSNFLENVALAPAAPLASKRTTASRSQRDRRRLLIGRTAAAILLLAGLVLTLRTKDGTLTIEVNEPDAQVQVLDAGGRVEITRKGEQGPLTIAVDPGQHRIKVQKDGFELFTQEFEMKSGGKTSIIARLAPLVEKVDGTASKPAVPVATPIGKVEPAPASPAIDATRPARFDVLGMESFPLKDNPLWSDFPDVLQEAVIYERSADPQPEGVTRNELALTVTESGLLVIAACWENDGNPGGGWYETRTTEEALIQQGWQSGSTLKRTDKEGVNSYRLFLKPVAEGERVQFHTRKYRPPRVIDFKPGTVIRAESFAKKELIPEQATP